MNELLGKRIKALRTAKHFTQEQLAEHEKVNRSHISSIEAPGIARPFFLEVFFLLGSASFMKLTPKLKTAIRTGMPNTAIGFET